MAGRKRDASIDERVLAVARRHLALYGYEQMSLVSVATEAGTTRQALYRRWPGKAELAAAAVAGLQEDALPPAEGDPYQALVAELTDFAQAVSRPGRMSLVGTMLQQATEPEVLSRYRARVIAPRRQRLREIFEVAAERGLIDAAADLEIAVTLCTGSWYARCLATSDPIAHWPERTAAMVWRALGGTPPS